MDEMNIMMKFRGFPTEMRQRLRGFVASSKTAQRQKRHREILCSLSPGLRGEVALQINRVWLEKVSFLKPFMHSQGIPAVIVEICLVMQFEMYAQSETLGHPQVLYIMHRGLVSHRGRLRRQGSVWGIDFVLSDLNLIEPTESFCLTYTEVATLQRGAFLGLLVTHQQECPEIAKHVRWYICWMAFQRALLVEAHHRARGTKRATAASSSNRPGT